MSFQPTNRPNRPNRANEMKRRDEMLQAPTTRFRITTITIHVGASVRFPETVSGRKILPW